MAPIPWHGRRGFLREVGFILLIMLCLLAAFVLARGDATTMTAAFIRRVRAMGNPE